MALLPSPASCSCRCGESQQRWNHWLWLANWSWASSPAGSVWLHTGFHRCLSQGRSTGYTALTEHILRSQSTEITVLKPDSYKRNCKLRDTVISFLFWKGEQAQICMAELQHLCTNIGTISAESHWGKLCCHFPSLVLLKRLSQILIISHLLLLLMGVSC